MTASMLLKPTRQVVCYSIIMFSFFVLKNIDCIIHNFREVLCQLSPARTERQPDRVILAGYVRAGISTF